MDTAGQEGGGVQGWGPPAEKSHKVPSVPASSAHLLAGCADLGVRRQEGRRLEQDVTTHHFAVAPPITVAVVAKLAVDAAVAAVAAVEASRASVRELCSNGQQPVAAVDRDASLAVSSSSPLALKTFPTSPTYPTSLGALPPCPPGSLVPLTDPAV